MQLSVSGDVDISNVAVVTAELGRLAAARTDVLLDLSELGFIDVSGARAMLGAVRGARQRGVQIQLAGDVLPRVRRVFELVDGVAHE